jgi:putative membrane protein
MKRLAIPLLMIFPFAAALAADGPDASFYTKAAEGGIAEVELGKLAQQRSSNQSVKDFGAMMVKDHGAANEKLKTVAASKSLSLPTSPSMGQMATKTKLEVLSGGTFDKSYVKSMVADHKDTIDLFSKEAMSGQDPDAKAFATATLPTLKSHYKMIETIAAQAGFGAD